MVARECLTFLFSIVSGRLLDLILLFLWHMNALFILPYSFTPLDVRRLFQVFQVCSTRVFYLFHSAADLGEC